MVSVVCIVIWRIFICWGSRKTENYFQTYTKPFYEKKVLNISTTLVGRIEFLVFKSVGKLRSYFFPGTKNVVSSFSLKKIIAYMYISAVARRVPRATATHSDGHDAISAGHADIHSE